MGSWNKTCGLSNLHIKWGEKAYVFVLEPATDENDRCYATHLFKPLLLPFETEYNDYGGGENSTGAGFPVVMEAIKKNLHEIELGDNKYHDIAVKKDAFDEELFFEAVHEGRLFRKGNFADPVRLEYVMFRKDIVDDILENRTIEQYVGKGKGTYCPYGEGDNSYIQYKFADIVADILPMIQELCEELKGLEEELRLMKMWDGVDRIFDYDHPNLAAKWMRGDNYRYCRLVDTKDILRDAFAKGDPTLEKVMELQAVFTEFIKGKFIDQFMEVTRKTWIPGGHEGSQCQERDEYRLLIDAMTKVLDAEEAEYSEEEEEA
jgi:hypothetical protein